MKPVPIMGLGMQSGFPSVTAQERVNCYLENQGDGEKSTIVAYGTPGLELFAEFSAVPARGGLSLGDYGYIVQQDGFYTIDNAGLLTLKGTIGTSTGRVSLATNGTQIFIADGTANAYYYTIATGVLAQSNSVAIQTCCFMDGYVVGNKVGTGEYYLSDLYDCSTWDPLAFATAESNPDNLVAVFPNNGLVILFGTDTSELVGNSGGEDFPFSRIGTAIEWGLAARWSVQKLGDAVCFLARNKLGQAQVALIQGSQVQAISTYDIDRIINNAVAFEGASAYSFMMNGHQFYQLSVAGYSFLYDLTTGVWSTTKGHGINRHRGEWAINLVNRTLVSDFENGRLYRLSDTAYDDAGDPLIMTLIGKHVFNNHEPFSVSELFIDMEPGVGLTSGQGVNPQIVMETSTDGGHTFGNPMWGTMGAIGAYFNRCSWWRIGYGFHFTFKLTISDPVRRAIIGAWILHD